MALLVAAATALMLTTTSANAAPTASKAGSGSVTVPISSTATSPNAFTGALTVSKFTNSAGQLTASGTLTGTVTDAATGASSAVTQPVSAAVTATGSCTILDLTLGPLHLDLLGLVVDLNAVHLTITAQQGPGNLLGNLLCAVANLLNGGLNLSGIAALLNQILAVLSSL
ncbi:MAG TPA: hypothetical protein VJ851_15615 [Jatrophihabitans sp.]|nr:hypothetical protein [Jatrophihabitans sp.]